MTVAEKREVLAAWASDAHAVPDAPGLRQIDNGPVVSVDVILDGLRRLDSARPPLTSAPKRRDVHGRRHIPFIGTLLRRKGHSDDDDDPPPSPAAAFPIEVERARRRKWETAPEPLAA